MVYIPIQDQSSENELEVKGRRDVGDIVLERFRYQFTYTAILAMEMYRENKYIEIFCEYHEDIVLVLPSKNLIGIQIKTRELGYGPFSLSDSQMQNTILNFIKLNSNNPNRFDKFVIVSNCGFSKKENGIDHLLQLLDDSNYIPTSEIEQIINKTVIKKSKESKNDDKKINSVTLVTLDQCISVLRKLECIEGPGLHEIHEIACNRLQSVQFAGNQNVVVLDRIVKRMVEIILYLSSKKLDNVIPTYCNILDKKSVRARKEIDSKRLSLQHVDQILKEYGNSLYLQQEDRKWNFAKEGSVSKMIEKLRNGGIAEDEVDILTSFFEDARIYMISESHKYLDKKKFLHMIEQIKKIVLNIAIESKPNPKEFEEEYGVEKLRLIESKLNDLTIRRHEDVFKYPYEILKGIVGILTGDCTIWFVDKNLKKNDI